MRKDAKKVLLAGALVAVVISLLAPFLASSNPDGLDKSVITLVGGGDEEKAEEIVSEHDPIGYKAPFPDYSIEGFDKAGEVMAILIGTIVMLIIGIAAGHFLKKS